MQRAFGKCTDSLPLHGSSTSVNQVSGAHSLAISPEASRASELAEPDFELIPLSNEAPESELARVNAALTEREKEIAALRDRLATLERSQNLEPCSVESAAPSSVESAAPSSVESAAPSSVESAAPSSVESAAPICVPIENVYPTLLNVAVAYNSGSLPPARLSDSIAPSQRQTPRRSFEIELEFTEDTHFYAGLTQDISQGGVFIATYHVRPIGSRLDLSFELPDGTQVKTSGHVRWLREDISDSARPGMGVAFSNLPEHVLTAIDRFCRERPPLYIEF